MSIGFGLFLFAVDMDNEIAMLRSTLAGHKKALEDEKVEVMKLQRKIASLHKEITIK